MTKKLLFISGSMNITTQMQQIAAELPEYEKYFTPFYADGFIKLLNKLNPGLPLLTCRTCFPPVLYSKRNIPTFVGAVSLF